VVRVDAEPVEPHRLGVLQLVQELVVETSGSLGVEQGCGHVDPHRGVARLEVGRLEAVRHQVKERDLHRRLASRDESMPLSRRPAAMRGRRAGFRQSGASV